MVFSIAKKPYDLDAILPCRHFLPPNPVGFYIIFTKNKEDLEERQTTQKKHIHFGCQICGAAFGGFLSEGLLF